MRVILILLLSLLVGCTMVQEAKDSEKKYLMALSNCVDRLKYHSSFLIDQQTGFLNKKYQKVRVVESEGSLISHIQFGVNDLVSSSTISDERSGTCWFDANYKVVALEAPSSSETIGITKYDALRDSLIEKELRGLKRLIGSQDTRMVFETTYVYDAGEWVEEGRKKRVEKLDGNLEKYVNDQLRTYDRNLRR